MNLCLHSCSSHVAFRHSFSSTCLRWQSTRSVLQHRKETRQLVLVTAAVLSPSRPDLRIPGVGDLKNLSVDLSDVPDGRYREVKVSKL